MAVGDVRAAIQIDGQFVTTGIYDRALPIGAFGGLIGINYQATKKVDITVGLNGLYYPPFKYDEDRAKIVDTSERVEDGNGQATIHVPITHAPESFDEEGNGPVVAEHYRDIIDTFASVEARLELYRGVGIYWNFGIGPSLTREKKKGSNLYSSMHLGMVVATGVGVSYQLHENVVIKGGINAVGHPLTNHMPFSVNAHVGVGFRFP